MYYQLVILLVRFCTIIFFLLIRNSIIFNLLFTGSFRSSYHWRLYELGYFHIIVSGYLIPTDTIIICLLAPPYWI